MITKIIETLNDRFEEELATKSSYYDDDLVDTIVLREINQKDPTPTIGFLVGEARPKDYEVGIHYPATWVQPLQVQIFVKHMSREEGFALIRTLVRRTMLCLFRDETKSEILTSDSMGVLTERVNKYNITGKAYSFGGASGSFAFGAAINMEFEIEMIIH